MAGYLIEPGHDAGWVFCNKNIDKEDIKGMLISSQVFISDLDYTLADSPTLAFTKRNFFRNVKTLGWGLEFFFKYLLKGKGTEQSIWDKYFKILEEDLEKMEYTEKDILKNLYPGVQDFFISLKKNSPDQKKILVTRTAPQIALPYKDLLWFDEAYCQTAEKWNPIKKFNGNIKKIAFAGDSVEDENLLNEAKKSNLDYCLSIYIAESPKKINERFCINIGRNWKGLSKILEG